MNENIFLEPGQIFRVVGINEILKPEYLVRCKYESPPLSENGGWEAAFKSETWKGTAWHRADAELTAWVGKTYRDLMSFGSQDVMHEIIELIN
jgi:hypothetical protein